MTDSPNLIEAIDVSRYAGTVPADRWKAAHDDHGVGLAIIQAWSGKKVNPHADQYLADARAAGMVTAAYVLLNSRPGRQAAILAEQACGTEWQHLSFVALDVELDGVTEQIILDCETEIRAEKLRPILYTGYWFWATASRLGNPTWASHLPLWDARADHVRSLDWDHHAPYGGWTARVGKQYAADDKSLGIWCDRSVFDAGWLAAAT